MTTAQGSQRQTTIRAPRRYSISLPLRYKATSKYGPLHGFGQAMMMSSRDIIFAPADGLRMGMIAEIAVVWPVLLEGHIRLELVLSTVITGSHDGVAEACILAYYFHIRRSAEAENRTEPTRIEGSAPSIHYPMAAH